MTGKSWLDVLMSEELFSYMVLKFMFDLDPGAVYIRDVATREKLAKLLRSDSDSEGIVGEMGDLNVESDSD